MVGGDKVESGTGSNEETDRLMVTMSQNGLRLKHERTRGPPYMSHPLPLTNNEDYSHQWDCCSGQYRLDTTLLV